MSWFGKAKTGVAGRASKAKKRKRGGRNVLMAISLMLAASGLLRLGSEAGSAFASGSGEIDSGPATTGDAACTTPDDIAAVLAALDAREHRVAARESALADRLQALSVAEAQTQLNLDALTEAENRLAATMARASTAAEKDLERLTSVYENMKPKEAAPVFAAMDPKFAAGFLGRMRPDVAASIMAGLEPETAYAISALLAGRNANAPTE